MINPISTDIEKKIHHLCDEIASAEDLSEELHTELYTHIEDKVLGYLSGEELLSDEDAFLLAEAHFGDRALVRFQLEDVHPVKGATGFMRRLAVPIMVYLCLITLYSSVFSLLAFAEGEAISAVTFHEVIIFFASVSFIFVQFKVLGSWKRRELAGEDLWYQTWSVRKLYAAIVILCVVLSLLSTVRILVWLAISDPEQELVFQLSSLYTNVILYAPSMATLIAWYMWFDVKPRARGTIVFVGLAFVVMQGIFSIVSSPVWMLPSSYKTGFVLMEGQFYSVIFNIGTSIGIFYSAISFYVLPTICVCVLYSLWTFFRGSQQDDIGVISSDS